MTDVLCRVEVWEQGGFHSHACGRKARAAVLRTRTARGRLRFQVKVGDVLDVCGLHLRVALRDGFEQVRL